MVDLKTDSICSFQKEIVSNVVWTQTHPNRSQSKYKLTASSRTFQSEWGNACIFSWFDCFIWILAFRALVAMNWTILQPYRIIRTLHYYYYIAINRLAIACDESIVCYFPFSYTMQFQITWSKPWVMYIFVYWKLFD